MLVECKSLLLEINNSHFPECSLVGYFILVIVSIYFSYFNIHVTALFVASAVPNFNATWVLTVTWVNQKYDLGCQYESASYFLRWTDQIPNECLQRAKDTKYVCIRCHLTNSHPYLDTHMPNMCVYYVSSHKLTSLR